MNAFESSPYGAEVVRLMEEGFFDGTVGKLSASNADASAEVEDAVATAVLKLVSRGSEKDPVRDVRGYLYTAARNAVYDAHKRAGSLTEFDPDLHDQADPGEPADHQLIQKEAYRKVQRLVRKWPNRNMREYMLLFLDSLYYDEPLTITDAVEKLSDILGETVNPKSIGQWKRRGLERLVDDYEGSRSDDGADNEGTSS